MPHACTHLQAPSRAVASTKASQLISDGCSRQIVRCHAHLLPADASRRRNLHANSTQLGSKGGSVSAPRPTSGRQCMTSATAAPATADTKENATHDLKEYVKLAEELAQTAASIIVTYFRQPLDIDDKADNSPVTQADREAERAMRGIIAERYPDHGIFGEEEGMKQPKTGDDQYLWVLDPIDGTKSFITGKPVFGTLISLLHNGVPVIGVIDQPITKERWIGVKGSGTTLNGKQVHARQCQDMRLAYLYATTPHMFSSEDHTEQAFNNVRDAVRTTLYGCDCYAYGLLAAGCVDLVVEADLKPYDYMALVPIVQEAGGVMTDWLGNSLKWRCAPDGYLMGSLPGEVIAAGSAGIHEEALKLLDWETLQEQETPAYGEGATS